VGCCQFGQLARPKGSCEVIFVVFAKSAWSIQTKLVRDVQWMDCFKVYVFFQSESHCGNKRPQCTKKGSFFCMWSFCFPGSLYDFFFFMSLTRFSLCNMSRFRMSLTVSKILGDQFDRSSLVSLTVTATVRLCLIKSVSLLLPLIICVSLVCFTVTTTDNLCPLVCFTVTTTDNLCFPCLFHCCYH